MTKTQSTETLADFEVPELYPRERLATRDEYQLRSIANFTKYDIETDTVVYAGLTREQTIATARRSRLAVLAEMARRLHASRTR